MPAPLFFRTTPFKVILGAVVICALLAAAFWWQPGGAAAPGKPGFTTDTAQPGSASNMPAPPTAEAGIAETAEITVAPTAKPGVSPEQTTPTAKPSLPKTTPTRTPPPTATLTPVPQHPGDAITVTVSVRCDTALKSAQLSEEKRRILPADGTMLALVNVSIIAGQSAFDALYSAVRAAKLHMEFNQTPVYNAVYIMGIGNLYEFDCGGLSGWKFRVNGEFPLVSCNGYTLQSGDLVEFLYTCDLGKDIE